MIERAEPTFFKFETPGDVVEGVLIAVKRKAIDGKPAITYTVQDGEERIRFNGAYQINEKLAVSDIGHKIEVTFEGVDSTIGRGDNKMRHFQVRVSRNVIDKAAAAAAASADPTLITDDDIPF